MMSRNSVRGLMQVVPLGLVLGLGATPALAQRSFPVKVQNTEADPVPVRQAIQLLNADTQFTMSGSVINPGSQVLYTVPDDARLVIETLSVWSFTTNCAFYLKPSITTTAGGNASEFRLNTPARTYSPAGFYTHQLTQSIRLHADPGSVVYVNAIRTDGGCSVSIRYSLSGYLEPLE